MVGEGSNEYSFSYKQWENALAYLRRTPQVRDVLLYHVLSTTAFTTPVLAADLPTADASLATLGASASIPFVAGPPPTVDGAGIVTTDIGANDRGASMGPEALRVANLPQALGRRGIEVRGEAHAVARERTDEIGRAHV